MDKDLCTYPFLVNSNENFSNYSNLNETFHIRNWNFQGTEKEKVGISRCIVKWVPIGILTWNFQDLPSFYASSYGVQMKKIWGGWCRVWLKWDGLTHSQYLISKPRDTRVSPSHFNQTWHHPPQIFFICTPYEDA